MKREKMAVTLMLVMVIIAGCAAVQVQIDPVLIGKILARRVGYEVATLVPVEAVELIPYAQEVIEAEDPKEAAEVMAVKLLELQLPGQPLLAEDVKDLASIFMFETDWSNEYIDASRVIAEEFIKGIVLAQGG